MTLKPLPWSYSSLDDFRNCPLAFHEKRVAKTVTEEASPQMIWGNKVHKAFELYIKDGTPLPVELGEHKEYLDELAGVSADTSTERKVALNKRVRPCGFFDKDVWWRGVIDVALVRGEQARIVDYKTGKPHTKYEQLAMFALYMFAERPELRRIDVEFYWTKTKTTTARSYGRTDVPSLWAMFLPDLHQYVEAFQTDTWQPRPSGLCHGWCPVIDCEHWKPKRNR